MLIFLDTAEIAEIRRASDAGLIDGVTTNPSLVARIAGERDPRDVYAEICGAVDGPVSLEVVSLGAEEMVTEGRELADIAENAVVKVPLTEEGLKACRRLASEGIRVNVTLCFSVSQALLAAKANAAWVSPFVGRVDDISGEGLELLGQIRHLYDTYNLGTGILAASLRHPQHVVGSMRIGVEACTLPPKVLWMLPSHPLTESGLDAFMADWAALQGSR